MIVRNDETIAIHPWESVKGILMNKAIEEFALKAGISSKQAFELMDNLEMGGTITEKIAETLEEGGVGIKTFWLNLQEIYDRKASTIFY